MLANIITVAQQAAALFIMMAVGFVLYRTKVIRDDGVDQMTNVLLYIVAPCVVISSLDREFDSELARELLFMGMGSLVLIGGTFALSLLIWRGQPDSDRSVLRSSLALTNGGFMGIPIAAAMFGEQGAMFASIYVCIFSLMQWVVSYPMMSGKVGVRRALLNPGTIGLVLGVLIFVFSVRLPQPVSSAVSMLSNVNSPLAMVVIGACIAKSDLLGALRDGRVYLVCLLRLIVLPAAALGLIMAVPLEMSTELKITLLIEFSAPCAAAVTMLSRKCGRNSELSGKLVAVSTVLSIITMPVIIAAGQTLL